MIRMPGDTQKKGENMKRIIMLTMVLVMMLVSLGGCFLPYEGHGRGGGRDDRDGGRDDRGGHDRGGERGGDRDGRR
jgi:hypothetical protein